MVIAGMFLSRAMMSIGMITLVIHTLAQWNKLKHLRVNINGNIASWCVLYFIVMALSLITATDTAFAQERFQIILPFVVLPLAFGTMGRWNQGQWTFFVAFFLSFLAVGMGWSMMVYFSHKEAYDAGYGLSQVIPTPFRNDHIRFSMAVIMGLCFGVEWLFLKQKVYRYAGMGFCVLAVIYLHILSSKTGLGLLYLLTLVYLFRHAIRTRKYWQSIILLFALGLMSWMMYQTSATFRNKLSYFRYSLGQIQNNELQPRVSDEGRIISYRYAWDAFRRKPLLGYGYGNVRSVMARYYEKDFPGQQQLILLPHNQFLVTLLAAGIPAVLLLCILLFSAWKGLRNSFTGLAFFLMCVVVMMIEPLLETQYGTTMFLFFLLVLLHRRRTAL